MPFLVSSHPKPRREGHSGQHGSSLTLSTQHKPPQSGCPFEQLYPQQGKGAPTGTRLFITILSYITIITDCYLLTIARIFVTYWNLWPFPLTMALPLRISNPSKSEKD